MNKIPLLEKFAAQSLVYVDTGMDDGKELIFSKEKFAELIVRECLSKIEAEAAQYAQPVWAFELVDDIKEHFGVK